MAEEEKLGKYKTDATLLELQAPSIFKELTWPIENGEGSVAEDVLSTFDLSGSATGGSSLFGYDIYNRDPYRMIQLSLAAAAFGDSDTDMKECYIDGDGDVVFTTIGGGIGGVTDIYYSIPSESYKVTCNTVVVTGCEIPPQRELRDPQNLFTLGNTDTVGETGPWYHVLGDIVPAKNMFQEGWIEYNRLETGDKIKDTWELGDFESIVTFAYIVKVGFFDSSCTDVQFNNTSTRYYKLSSFGTMQAGHKLKAPLEGTDIPPILEGVEVPDSSQKKFLGVKRVLIYGYKLNGIRFYHDAEGATTTPYVYIDTLQPNVFELRRGEDYVINKEAGKAVTITFANDVVKKGYREFFGKVPPGSPSPQNSSFKVHPESILTIAAPDDAKIPDPTVVVTGKLADGVSDAIGGLGIDTPSVFPIGKGESGYAVLTLFVEVEWDNPSVFIKDSRDIIKKDKLEKEVSIDIYPIVVDDPPAPMAHNGILITQTDVKPDDDPATVELGSRSEKQTILDSLTGGDINVTLPFLDEAGVITASSEILTLCNEDSKSIAYTCGPTCNPVLGGSGPDLGSVINRIVYSYQDSSRYVVNVYCGPQWQGINGWGQSINEAATEQKSFDGTVINASKNNTDFVVLVNGLGQIHCVNATKDIVCNGDKVKITVYNNPSGVR